MSEFREIAGEAWRTSQRPSEVQLRARYADDERELREMISQVFGTEWLTGATWELDPEEELAVLIDGIGFQVVDASLYMVQRCPSCGGPTRSNMSVRTFSDLGYLLEPPGTVDFIHTETTGCTAQTLLAFADVEEFNDWKSGFPQRLTQLTSDMIYVSSTGSITVLWNGELPC